MQQHHLDGDGINPELYKTLARESKTTLKAVQLPFKVPDTVIYWGCASLWYFWSSDTNSLQRYPAKALEKVTIYRRFTNKHFVGGGSTGIHGGEEDEEDADGKRSTWAGANAILDDDAGDMGTGAAGRKAGRAAADIVALFIDSRSVNLDITYFTKESLKQFLFTDKKWYGMLQMFVAPRLDHVDLVQAMYSPAQTFALRRVNRNKVYDGTVTPMMRSCTFDGPTFQCSEHYCLPHATALYKELCAKFVEFFANVSPKHTVERMVAYFRQDSHENYWLLFTTSIRVAEVKDPDRSSDHQQLPLYALEDGRRLWLKHLKKPVARRDIDSRAGTVVPTEETNYNFPIKSRSSSAAARRGSQQHVSTSRAPSSDAVPTPQPERFTRGHVNTYPKPYKALVKKELKRRDMEEEANRAAAAALSDETQLVHQSTSTNTTSRAPSPPFSASPVEAKGPHGMEGGSLPAALAVRGGNRSTSLGGASGTSRMNASDWDTTSVGGYSTANSTYYAAQTKRRIAEERHLSVIECVGKVSASLLGDASDRRHTGTMHPVALYMTDLNDEKRHEELDRERRQLSLRPGSAGYPLRPGQLLQRPSSASAQQQRPLLRPMSAVGASHGSRYSKSLSQEEAAAKRAEQAARLRMRPVSARLLTGLYTYSADMLDEAADDDGAGGGAKGKGTGKSAYAAAKEGRAAQLRAQKQELDDDTNRLAQQLDDIRRSERKVVTAASSLNGTAHKRHLIPRSMGTATRPHSADTPSGEQVEEEGEEIAIIRQRLKRAKADQEALSARQKKASSPKPANASPPHDAKVDGPAADGKSKGARSLGSVATSAMKDKHAPVSDPAKLTKGALAVSHSFEAAATFLETVALGACASASDVLYPIGEILKMMKRSARQGLGQGQGGAGPIQVNDGNLQALLDHSNVRLVMDEAPGLDEGEKWAAISETASNASMATDPFAAHSPTSIAAVNQRIGNSYIAVSHEHNLRRKLVDDEYQRTRLVFPIDTGLLQFIRRYIGPSSWDELKIKLEDEREASGNNASFALPSSSRPQKESDFGPRRRPAGKALLLVTSEDAEMRSLVAQLQRALKQVPNGFDWPGFTSAINRRRQKACRRTFDDQLKRDDGEQDSEGHRLSAAVSRVMSFTKLNEEINLDANEPELSEDEEEVAASGFHFEGESPFITGSPHRRVMALQRQIRLHYKPQARLPQAATMPQQPTVINSRGVPQSHPHVNPYHEAEKKVATRGRSPSPTNHTMVEEAESAVLSGVLVDCSIGFPFPAPSAFTIAAGNLQQQLGIEAQNMRAMGRRCAASVLTSLLSTDSAAEKVDSAVEDSVKSPTTGTRTATLGKKSPTARGKGHRNPLNARLPSSSSAPTVEPASGAASVAATHIATHAQFLKSVVTGQRALAINAFRRSSASNGRTGGTASSSASLPLVTVTQGKGGLVTTSTSSLSFGLAGNQRSGGASGLTSPVLRVSILEIPAVDEPLLEAAKQASSRRSEEGTTRESPDSGDNMSDHAARSPLRPTTATPHSSNKTDKENEAPLAVSSSSTMPFPKKEARQADEEVQDKPVSAVSPSTKSSTPRSTPDQGNPLEAPSSAKQQSVASSDFTVDDDDGEGEIVMHSPIEGHSAATQPVGPQVEETQQPVKADSTILGAGAVVGPATAAPSTPSGRSVSEDTGDELQDFISEDEAEVLASKPAAEVKPSVASEPETPQRHPNKAKDETPDWLMD